MCPPDHYGIEYEINPWMSRSRGADRARAMRQWRGLCDALVGLGAKVSLVDPVAGLPDMVFTANAGMMYRNIFVSSRFRPAVRAGESPHFEHWFESAGFAVHRLKEGSYFEGAGDALFCGSTLFGGYRIRSDARSHQDVARLIGCEALPVELVNPYFYHLDTCFCPLEPGAAIWFPDAFDFYGQQVIRSNAPNLIDVTRDDAHRFGCNAVVVGRTVIIPADCATLRRDLESRGFAVRELELDEFLKAGGSAKCLTLRIDGEEAAIWAATPGTG
jgi:N-dimethylarginine dimethylaminohydrolase